MAGVVVQVLDRAHLANLVAVDGDGSRDGEAADVLVRGVIVVRGLENTCALEELDAEIKDYQRQEYAGADQKFFLEKFLHVLWCSFVYTLIIMCTANNNVYRAAYRCIAVALPALPFR